jgi:hypothetical protein
MNTRIAFIFALSACALCAHAQPGYPVVSKAAQKARDDDRQTILETELQAESEALAKAQSVLAHGASPDREAEVHRHQENVKALRRELASVTGKPLPRDPVRVVVRAAPAAPTAPASSDSEPSRFWNPYNRASDTTDFSTASRRALP